MASSPTCFCDTFLEGVFPDEATNSSLEALIPQIGGFRQTRTARDRGNDLVHVRWLMRRVGTVPDEYSIDPWDAEPCTT